MASTAAAAGLTSTPSVDGFADAFTVFTIVAAAAAAVALRLVPPAAALEPQTTSVRHSR